MRFPEYDSLDATDLAKLIRDGEASPRELLDAAIERAEAQNPRLNAIVAKSYERAYARIEAGLPAGPLHGVPFTVTTPSGADVAAVAALDGRLQSRETFDAGLYTVTPEGGDGDPRTFALFDSDEIRLAPQSELTLGGDTVQATPGSIRRNFLLRDPLLLLALGVLLLEWALWCGRR